MCVAVHYVGFVENARLELCRHARGGEKKDMISFLQGKLIVPIC